MTSDVSTVLAGERLDGLELLLDGLLGDVDGYSLPGEDHPEGDLAVSIAVRVSSLSVGDTLTLEDPDRTPLARLEVTGVRDAGGAGTWVAGRVRRLRRAEHGLARERRLPSSVSFAGRHVCLFTERYRASDVLQAVDSAGGRPMDFVVTGRSNSPDAARAVDDLHECAQRIPGARTWFIPQVDLGTDADIVADLVTRLGAADPTDFRSRASAHSGAVVLFTGLSGAGKSTLARALLESLHVDGNQGAVLLDGDDVRREIAGELGFSAADRDRNLQRIAWVAARIAEVGGIAICAPIAPFEASRAEMRAKVEPTSRFFVVHVSTPLATAEGRDRKGLYAKARAGLIRDFTGIDSPYEEPRDADVVVDTTALTVQQCIKAVRRELRTQGILGAA